MQRLHRLFTSRRHRYAVMAAGVALVLPLQACGTAERASASTHVDRRFFGMHVPSLDTAFPGALVGTTGAVDLTSNNVYWSDLQPSQDSPPDFSRLDAMVSNARTAGAQPLLVLGRTPSWAGATPASPPSLDAWKAYVKAIVKRYRTHIDYEIWPEPNISSNWSGSPRQLAQLVASASAIIHRVAPHAVVVSPAMVLRMKYQRVFMDKFFAVKIGGKRIGTKIDAVGLDPYPVVSGTPEDSMALLGKARAILRSHKVTAPIWSVEMNYGVQGGGQPIAHHSSATRQASYVVRTYVLSAAAHVKRVYWLGWGSYDTMDVALASSTGSPTKAGRAYVVVARWLAGQRPGACVRTTTKHLYTCKLVKDGRASWVYWTTKGKTVVRVPKGARKVVTMTGDVSRTRAGRRLTVTTSPVWVHH